MLIGILVSIRSPIMGKFARWKFVTPLPTRMKRRWLATMRLENRLGHPAASTEISRLRRCTRVKQLSRWQYSIRAFSLRLRKFRIDVVSDKRGGSVRENAYNFIQKCIPFVSSVPPSVEETEEPFVLMIATNFNLSLYPCKNPLIAS